MRPETPAGEANAANFRPDADFRSTVRNHLATNLEGDSNRGEILELAERFLAQEAAS